MRKREQEHKEQERPRRYYFFDYLFWLGEMARWHYKGEPRRPDGNAMLMLCIIPPIRDFIAIGMAVVSGVGVVNSLDRIYPPSRRKAVMRHYEGRKFSPARCYFFVFFLAFLLIAQMCLWGTMLRWINETAK